MVPAPKTSAPLAALYRVRWWVAVPSPYVEPKSWRTWTPLLVVEESGTSPAGRVALSGASSHSYPSVPSLRVAVWPGACEAMLVLRQMRILPSAAGTSIAEVPELTLNIVPVTAFSGRPPSAGGLKRGSRQVPVHTLGSPGGPGSILAFAWVSL